MVELNGNQVREALNSHTVIESFPDAWAAPATVSRCGRINQGTSEQFRGSRGHCEFSSSWEGDTSNPASPDTGLERIRNYRVGRCPDRDFDFRSRVLRGISLLITWG